MKRLIDAIIAKWFCLHDWKDVYKTRRFSGDPTMGEVTRNVSYTVCCNKCGRFKTIKAK